MKTKITLLFLITTNFAFAQNKIALDEQGKKFIDSLMGVMTLQEKIGQMTIYTSDLDVTGPSMHDNYSVDVKEVKAARLGAIFNAYGPKYVRAFQHLAVDSTRLHIPLLFGSDVIHGHITIFPVPLGEAASWDMNAIEKSERVAADESAADGLNWTFAPMVDIARDPRWGRVVEGAGEDPYLGSQIAKARVLGFQGNLGDTNSILACAKHFAAYGAPIGGRDYNTVDMSIRTLREVYLPPYKACVDAGVGTIMSSFNEINGIPSTGNRWLLTELLRREWGFKGLVVTDYSAVEEMIAHGFAKDGPEAALKAANAGVDMDMQDSLFMSDLQPFVTSGQVKQSEIDSAVKRILTLKYLLGLFKDPYRYCNEERAAHEIMTQSHLDASRDMARKSMVLLKNSNSVLPLKNETSIALIGPLADDPEDMLGPAHAAGDGKKAISVLQGLKNRLGDKAKINYVKGCNINDTIRNFSEAIKAVKKADVVVIALGESEDMSSEASSRSDISLPGVQQELFDAVCKLGKPVVVLLMNGRPLTIPDLDEKATAILETWFLGSEAGNAIADVLYGDYNPSGKLTITFPRSVGQIPIFYSTKNTGRPMNPNDKYTSKYLDIPNTPLYPFGYGLSYTQFKYSGLTLSKSSMNFSDSMQVSVTLTNAGSRDGEEVVQLYTRDWYADVTRPVKELKGFQKVFLKAGESRKITFTISGNDLKFFDAEMRWRNEEGKYTAFVGGNSVDDLSADFQLVK